MKIITIILCAISASLRAQGGGPFTLDWSSIDGGSVTAVSSGGRFTLNGTIGQTDAGASLRGGRFDVVGGFWSFLTVLSVPDAPELTLRLVSGGNLAVLSWDVKTLGWQVEMSTDLKTWRPVPAKVSDTPDHHTVTLPAVQRQIFRMAEVSQ